MIVRPRNRRIRLRRDDPAASEEVNPLETFIQQAAEAVTDDGLYYVVECAPDSTVDITKGQLIKVTPNMVESFVLGNERVYLVLENYVECILEQE